jgi:hypothetical protein
MLVGLVSGGADDRIYRTTLLRVWHRSALQSMEASRGLILMRWSAWECYLPLLLTLDAA